MERKTDKEIKGEREGDMERWEGEGEVEARTCDEERISDDSWR